MSKLDELMYECRSWALNCSVTYQSITDYSVEIYKGYGKRYVKVFYSDGHLTSEEAIKEGLKFINAKQ